MGASPYSAGMSPRRESPAGIRAFRGFGEEG